MHKSLGMKNTEKAWISSCGLQHVSSLALFLRQHEDIYADVSVEMERAEELTH